MTHTADDHRRYHDTRLYFRYDSHPDTTFSLVVPNTSTVDDLRPLIRDTEELECDPCQIGIYTPDGLEALSDDVTVHDLLRCGGGRCAATGAAMAGTAAEEASCFVVQIHEQNSLEEDAARVSARIYSLHARPKEGRRRKKKSKPLREKVLRKQLLQKMDGVF